MSTGAKKKDLVVFEANMDAGLRRHYRRTHAEAVTTEMPFDEMLRREDDGIESDEGIGEYEMRQRVMGVRALFRYLKGSGLQMEAIMQQLFCAGRAVHDEFFASISMTESALMFSKTRAAHSWRCKVISGRIKLTGMKGVRLPGQKTPESSEVYAAAAKGNTNRKAKRNGKAVQKSFLRQLKVPKGTGG